TQLVERECEAPTAADRILERDPQQIGKLEGRRPSKPSEGVALAARLAGRFVDVGRVEIRLLEAGEGLELRLQPPLDALVAADLQVEARRYLAREGAGGPSANENAQADSPAHGHGKSHANDSAMGSRGSGRLRQARTKLSPDSFGIASARYSF